jgi:hypothetical protein
MEKWGNGNANAFWEANMPAGYKVRLANSAFLLFCC